MQDEQMRSRLFVAFLLLILFGMSCSVPPKVSSQQFDKGIVEFAYMDSYDSVVGRMTVTLTQDYVKVEAEGRVFIFPRENLVVARSIQ